MRKAHHQGDARKDGEADPRIDHERRGRRGGQAGVTRRFLLLVAALAGFAYWASSPTTATVAVANCSAPTRPSFLPSDMTVAFCDDFAGSALDTTKWYPNWFDSTGCAVIGAGEGSQAVDTARPKNVSVSGGYLHLTTRRESFTCPGYGMFPYTSGLVQTGGHYSQAGRVYDVPPLYTCSGECYVETRFKMQSPGPWPAVWMLESPADGRWSPGHEIDNLEQWGKNFKLWQFHVHLLCAGTVTQAGTGYRGPNTTSGFHTSGLWRRASSVGFYADDRLGWTYTGCGIPPSGVPYYLLLNGGVIGNLGQEPSVLPWEMLVDFVRVWSRP